MKSGLGLELRLFGEWFKKDFMLAVKFYQTLQKFCYPKALC